MRHVRGTRNDARSPDEVPVSSLAPSSLSCVLRWPTALSPVNREPLRLPPGQVFAPAYKGRLKQAFAPKPSIITAGLEAGLNASPRSGMAATPTAR